MQLKMLLNAVKQLNMGKHIREDLEEGWPWWRTQILSKVMSLLQRKGRRKIRATSERSAEGNR